MTDLQPPARSARDPAAEEPMLSGQGVDSTLVSGVGTVEAGPPQAVDEKAVATQTALAGGPLRQSSLFSDAWRQLRRNPFFLFGAVVLTVLTVMAIVPGMFTDTDPRACQLTRAREAPSARAWFGYDALGCDYYSNVVYGARVSIVVGVLVVTGILALGVALGSIAGYYAGWVDSLIARFTDIWYGIPTILGAIMVLQLFTSRGVLQVTLVLIVLNWMTPLRLIRSTVISVKETDYVHAARALGAPTRRIIVRHILPNAIAPVLVYSTIAIGSIVATEATLSFLGVGLQQPAISWGLQINVGQKWIRDAPHLVFFPSVFLSLTVLSFILMGDALRDALDPKLR
jgi:oligopeptide transport system permease protein